MRSSHRWVAILDAVILTCGCLVIAQLFPVTSARLVSLLDVRTWSLFGFVIANCVLVVLAFVIRVLSSLKSE